MSSPKTSEMRKSDDLRRKYDRGELEVEAEAVPDEGLKRELMLKKAEPQICHFKFGQL